MTTHRFLKRPLHDDATTLFEKRRVVELIEFERFCRDNALWDEMRRCFAPESRVTISWFRGSGAEFVEASSRMKTSAPHKLNDTLVWLSGERAVALTMASIQSRVQVEGHTLDLTSYVKLLFRARRIDGEWYLAALDGIYEKDSLVPASPDPGAAVPREELARYRPSYANLSYVLGKEGYAIDTGLPGIDRPELVEALYAEASAWLAG